MTNQEAIEVIKLAQAQVEWEYPMDYATAFDMAISALEKQEANDSKESSLTQKALDSISRQAAIDALDCINGTEEVLRSLPSAQPEWNNHTVACLLAELFDDTCACNYNGIDEWLPSKCELLDSCPNPVGVACWEQYLKHRAERRTDERSD